ncbi:MAG: gamma carbonic anhydrase family protein [Candidatus Dactylopiibacterium carminicum]|uniref:Gamma carbonic anhydrase family protein n=1 Tax=Candidatus Dactylopiibacterium carminicum TaxID=857335 RepID=A0A272EU97_9RHOO|nr:gamma carbonic anhydrase family protein [Candidatus Dactylopiibacterium carminicum]KAF7599731.1 gamma carbonic anhydrase family protein [Candidatus Dactylopiibacterium carminicum]PAS93667.1 MAG: gamma carbonic anhydrase family protein [Candidatus Dactylopiibacterium carminicum]PAS97535.1 MAG: gamma carbonic anhydrase family protein [Candidatus Dactylopiibacterium carminicum]PAS99733.1 MAG: gamma carbonic anhydrase family protein [Candidatus Dactylopiibacterium carminicum]
MAVFALDEISPILDENVWVADSAHVIGRVILGADASVWFNAVLRGDNEPITIGARTNIQDGCVLHTDPGVPLTIGADVSVGHMAMLHGCTVGEGSLIGMNATLLNRSVIGKHCLIGAKTLIPEGKVIPDRSLVVGTPGRIIRELTDEEVARLAASTDAYIRQARRFRAGLRKLA